jgi:tocopherol O-methyltransferase
LKPGGRFVVCSWLAGESPKPWEVRHLLEPICTEGRLPSLGSESDYRTLFAAAGFQVAAFHDLSRNVKRTWSIIIGRMAKRLTRDPEARRFLLNGANRVFGKTIFRLWIAYRTGSLRYGLFVATRP